MVNSFIFAFCGFKLWTWIPKQVYMDQIALICFIKSNLIAIYAESIRDNIESSQNKIQL